MMNIVASRGNVTRGRPISARAGGAFRQPPGRDRSLVKIREPHAVLDHDGTQAAAVLRGDEYIVRRGWLSEASLSPSGGETDHFDEHSTHFAVLESDATGSIEASATVRLIEPVSGELPAYELFPELRDSIDAHEVSRYIAHTPSASLAIRAVIVAHLLESNVPGVAIITRGLQRLLGKQGLVVRELMAPRVAPMYGSHPQVAIEVDAAASAEQPELADLVAVAMRHDWDAVLQGAEHAY